MAHTDGTERATDAEACGLSAKNEKRISTNDLRIEMLEAEVARLVKCVELLGACGQAAGTVDVLLRAQVPPTIAVVRANGH